jgi:hypothetical protein
MLLFKFTDVPTPYNGKHTLLGRAGLRGPLRGAQGQNFRVWPVQELMTANGYSKTEIAQAEREVQKALGGVKPQESSDAEVVSQQNPGSSRQSASTSTDKLRANAALTSSQTLVSWSIFERVWLMELVPPKLLFD